MSEWVNQKLGDVLEIKYGKDHKKLSVGETPCYGSGGIMRYVNKQLYDKESILIPRKGSLNNIYFINKPFWTVDTLFWSKIDIEKVFPKFLFYQLTEIDFTRLNVGSAVPSLTVQVLNEIKIKLPNLSEQKSIAETLTSLDDKIDLLHCQNRTLEAMAETLFREWFVEGAEEDWELKEIGDFLKVVDNRGKTPPNQKEETDFPVIEVNALGKNDRLVDYSVIRKYVDQVTFDNWFRNKPQKYDTLFSTVGSIGEISMFLIEKGNIAQNVIALHPENLSPFYIYQYLKYRKNEIAQLDIGGVQPSIKVPHLLSMHFQVPPKKLQDDFDKKIIDFINKIENNYIQIQTLEKLRDTLLPKLMNQEINLLNDL